MAGKIRLRNKTKRPITIMLLHNLYCAKVGKCSCTAKTVKVISTGDSGDKQAESIRRKIPASVIIMPGACSRELDSAALHLEDVKSRVQPRGDGTLDVLSQDKPKKRTKARRRRSSTNDNA